ncbi:MAG: hypothetical protein ABIK62_01515 [candidate division WOR-3 bacterium]
MILVGLLSGELFAQTDDILLNDDTCGGIEQSWPVVVRVSDGYIVAWQDYRVADFDPNIMVQKSTFSGQRLGRNHIVNDDTTSRNVLVDYLQACPTVAQNQDRVLVAWEDSRGGKRHVRFRFLDRDARPISPVRTVPKPAVPRSAVGVSRLSPGQSPGFPGEQIGPVACALANGFVLAWAEVGPEGPHIIRGVLLDSSGRCGPVLSLSDNTRDDCLTPAVAADRLLTVAWIQQGEGRKLALRRFDMDGIALGPSLTLDTAAASHAPAIVLNSDQSGLVVWQDSAGRCISARPFTASGEPGLKRCLVQAAADSIGDLAMSRAGPDSGLLLSWTEFRGTSSCIQARFLDRAGNPRGGAFRPDSSQCRSARFARAAGDFALVWQDDRANNPDIYLRCSTDGLSQGTVRANDDRASSIQDFPVIVQAADRSAVVYWFDFRFDPSCPVIMGQRLDPLFRAVGGNFRVSDNPPGSSASFFWAAGNRSGKNVIAWQDDRNGDPDIYAQVYGPLGQALGGNFRVNDDTGRAHAQAWPHVTINDSGAFLITWTDARSGFPGVFAQYYDRGNHPVGPNRRIDFASQDPSGWLSNQGDCWITWKAGDGIKLRHFNARCEPEDSVLYVRTGPRTELAAPELVGTECGSLWIAWMDRRRGAWEVFGRRISRTGEFCGPDFRINDDTVICDHFLPNLVFDGRDRIMVTWSDSRIPGNLDVRCRIYDSKGQAQDTSYIVNTDPAPFVHQWAYGSCAARETSLLFTWIDNRNSRSWDVYVRRGLDALTPHPWWRSLIVMPSLVKDACRIRLPAITGSALLEVYDTVGRCLQKIVLPTGAGPGFMGLDCQGLAPGAYFLCLTDRQGCRTGRFTVIR